MKSFINIFKDIIPLSDFRSASKEFIEKLRSLRQPIVLTQNGKSAAVLLAPQDYEQLQYEKELYRAIALGERDVEEGRVIQHDDLFAELLR